MILSDVRHAMACSPSSSASNESCLYFVAKLGLPIVLKTSESIWLYPMFAFICYVSIHLEISARVVRSPPQELPIGIRTTSCRDCAIGQGPVAKTEEAE